MAPVFFQNIIKFIFIPAILALVFLFFPAIKKGIKLRTRIFFILGLFAACILCVLIITLCETGSDTTIPQTLPIPVNFTVKYMKNGEDVKEEKEVIQGTEITISSGVGLSQWRSVFDGWKSSTEKYYKAGDTFSVTENVVFYPQWKPMRRQVEKKEFPFNTACPFFSGEIAIRINTKSTKYVPNEGYADILEGWVGTAGKQDDLSGYPVGRTIAFSETFDITINTIESFNAKATVAKYVP